MIICFVCWDTQTFTHMCYNLPVGLKAIVLRVKVIIGPGEWEVEAI